jgi:lysophospholipase L1-like esterase
VRKANRLSGLLKYQPKGEPSDWAAAAKQILATEKVDVIVVMLGLNDRVPIREPVVEKKEDKKDKKADAKKDSKSAKKDAKKDDKAAPKDATDDSSAKPDDEKPDTKTADTETEPDDDDVPSIAAPETAPRNANGMYNFRDERWVELYSKKIAEMIAVLKSKGVPVLWVGLPAVRGPKAMSDMLFLDTLYRDAANKAGITYVDVWDGFVDEQGRYIQQGPDFDGQTRRLRSYDGVYFTKAGAVKLARFTEREITRLLAARTLISLPSELQSPDATVRPSVSGPRPLVGPMVPLVASNVGTTELLGGAGTRPVSIDALAARTLVKGEPLSVPAGRADDFSWPRREIGSLEAPAGDPNVATIAPDGSIVKPLPKPAALRPPGQPGQGSAGFDPNRPPPQPGATQVFQPGAVQTQPGAPPRPRPPASVGPAAAAPGFFTR